MNVTKIFNDAVVVALVVITGCVEPYDPPAIKNAPSYLVVDGFVDATNASAVVKLSKTMGLEENLQLPVSNATVQLEEEDGFVMNLIEHPPGTYSISEVFVDFDKKYRIKISHENNEYASAFVEIKQTPPIDDVFWDPKPKGLEIKLNTSDPSGNSKYYRWKFEEIYEYTVPYYSGYVLKGGEVEPRALEDQIYRCWRTDNSTSILIGTTEDLTSDEIRNNVLLTIPRESIKITRRYSFRVQQVALTEEAYSYWLSLYKTTENVGGLFDPMPGQVIGNITNLSDPDKTVIGFFYGAKVSEHHMYIMPGDLPDDYWEYRWPYCELTEVVMEELLLHATGTLLVSPFYVGMDTNPAGYTIASTPCLDCRVYGGVTTKPEFWP